MSHLNLVSAILYLMVLPIPALWYYLAFQLREGGSVQSQAMQKSRIGRMRFNRAVYFWHDTRDQYYTGNCSTVTPDAMDNYQNLIENSGLTEYSLMWVSVH